jgi:1,2-diacylglycerol 3-alpha-glucosyltransferase
LIPNVHLLIVGGGKKQFEEELQNLIVQLGVGSRVCSTGMVSYEDIPSYLAMSDIFVTTSVTETFGMATVEAMGAGLPIMGIHLPGPAISLKTEKQDSSQQRTWLLLPPN